MEYQWKTTDIWSLNHLVYDENVACFGFPIPNHIILNYNKSKLKCQNCKQHNISDTGIPIPNVLHINRKIFI